KIRKSACGFELTFFQGLRSMLIGQLITDDRLLITGDRQHSGVGKVHAERAAPDHTHYNGF
ncbi:MAG: hypothetical protein NT154_41380, partial [Verrucomicrobia bacterium]|nr:hypothetical protein [Verrucomicrobiota bacterium]